ncbi:uncharacterized protein BKA55DRAFT_533591 [Fusarium redolens]|uniref:Uncharacterized protein n=1 Tax=Fusarium redolens TaxID=48865 RepID=A0A9P9KQQ6_FUSRE|nr:uncharacterized protein BKA55DRAFT_533591 [Fusarium redolens]KAH7266786.1 hypothetical protein BKA55DRAFT_533591 [Fusarium redolens]
MSHKNTWLLQSAVNEQRNRRVFEDPAGWDKNMQHATSNQPIKLSSNQFLSNLAVSGTSWSSVATHKEENGRIIVKSHPAGDSTEWSSQEINNGILTPEAELVGLLNDPTVDPSAASFSGFVWTNGSVPPAAWGKTLEAERTFKLTTAPLIVVKLGW